MSARQANCPNCRYRSGEKAGCFLHVIELFWLYLIGVYELVRQICQRRLHPSRFLPRKNSEINTQRKDTVRDGLERITIITGATSGIGREIQRELTRRGELLIILSYPTEVGTFPGQQEILVDFGCKTSTERAARQIRDILTRTSPYKSVLLFHCAGVYNPDVRMREFQSPTIFETYAVNTVMPVFFVQLLDDLITGIVYVGSSSQKVAPHPSLHACPFCIAKSPHAAYPLSKLLTFAFFERWSLTKKKPVIIIHPGVVITQLYRNIRGFMGVVLGFFLKLGALRADESARRVLQVVDEASFFEKMRKPIPTETDSDLSAIFWDATTMRPAMIPRQISDAELREWIYEHLSDVTAGWAHA